MQSDHGSTPSAAFAVPLRCRIGSELGASHISDVPISAVVYITKDHEISPLAALVLIFISKAPRLLVDWLFACINNASRCISVPDLQFWYSAKAFSFLLKLRHSHDRQNSSEVVLHCPNVVRLKVTEEGRVARVLIKGSESILDTNPCTNHGADHGIALIRMLVEPIELEPVEELGGVGVDGASADVAGSHC